jgi:transposase
MSKKATVPSKEELAALYHTYGETSVTVGTHYGVSHGTVRKWLLFYEIPFKDATESKQAANKRPKEVQDRVKFAHEKLSDYDWLHNQRVVLRKSKLQIANDLGCSHVLVHKFLVSNNITNFKLNESEYTIKSKLENYEYIKELYDSGMTMDKIAEEVGSSKATVSLYIKKLGLEVKPANSYERENNYRSKPEIEIFDFVQSCTSSEVLSNRKILDGVEFDILIPDRKIAIEFNGLYSHSEKEDATSVSLRKGPTYHLNKTMVCEKHGYFLFHIFGDQWKYKQDIIKSMIRYKLGVTLHRVYARQLQIKIVDYQERINFFNDNHLQGKDQASIAYGLFRGDELMCCASFSTPRFNNTYKWELIRFSTKLDHNICGGFSKLFKHFRKLHSGTIISYSDRTYSGGNLYEDNGFTLSHYNRPSYWYVKNDKRFPRTMFTKQQIARKFPEADLSMSEKEIMKELKYNRIWDCGTIAWVLE